MSAAKSEKTEKIKVMIVEDQPQILKNQLKILQEVDEIEVVGTALSGEAALEWLAANAGNDKKRPDVILEDLGLPRMSGIEVTKEVKKLYPSIEVLIFTIFDEEEKVIEAVKAGASGYLLKGATADKVVDAIREVKAGGSVIQPNLARRLLQHFKVPLAPEPKSFVSVDKDEPATRPLTEREVEILRLIAKGLSNNEAAGVLTLSRATVRTHLEHIYEKLEVTNRVEAVTEGLRKGIIEM